MFLRNFLSIKYAERNITNNSVLQSYDPSDHTRVTTSVMRSNETLNIRERCNSRLANGCSHELRYISFRASY